MKRHAPAAHPAATDRPAGSPPRAGSAHEGPGRDARRRDDLTASDAPVITARGIRKSYRGRSVLDRIDLTVHRGELFALLGPNGAGKTTLVEILEGYRRPDAGTVQVLGATPARAGAAWRARVGIVLQEASDFGELRCAEVLRHFARYYPDPLPWGEALAMVDLTRCARTRVARLSGGQRRRLDVALALLGRPELVFLDEPTTGLDPEARTVFWRTIACLRDRGTAFVVTTHHLDEAEQVADRLAVLASGRVMAQGTVDMLAEAVPDTVSVTWHTDKGVRTRETTRPTRLLRALLAEHDDEIPGLQVRRRSLEDIYTELIARAHDSTEDPR
ncbi:ABC transporter ATP-binding protein [Streptomyces sp. NPDC020096]